MTTNNENVPDSTCLDPLQLSHLIMNMGQQIQKSYEEVYHGMNMESFLGNSQHIWSWMQVWQEGMIELSNYPDKMSELAQEYIQDTNELLKHVVNSVDLDKKSNESFILPRKGDQRFKDISWNENPFFDYLKQSYLLWDRWMRKISHSLKEIDPKKASRFDFYTRQISDFFSPSNFIWTNPTILQKIIETNGQSLVQGMENLKRDLEKGKGSLDIKTVDYDAFKLGENLATTPGHIIFQNDLFQLIHYVSVKTKVHQVPLLIVPPCFNKFYIFDLRPENSFIKWCLSQGIQIFIMSWINPDEQHAAKSFEDYIFQGVGEAVQVVKSLTQTQKINALGFCIGGNFLCAYNAYEVACLENSFLSTSYFATLFDHTESGDLKIFLNSTQIDELEKQVRLKGYMAGKALAQTFSLMRANDLIWGFIVNNYLLGQEPAAFDLLYWNSDSTNMPASMYLYYVREILINNGLMKANSLVLKGVSIDLSKIRTPSYFLSTREDHIVPWRSSFAGFKLFQGPKKFVLGGSGHIAGIFNHPVNNKYMYWVSLDRQKYSFLESEDWLSKATEYPGSWWQDWMTWLQNYSGKIDVVHSKDESLFPNLECAPGSYVMQKRDN